ncbi:hypothetical protein B0H10DRAFT_1959051 [Mycena sp. CBHHK59/15]|nr:hypothetical protein B0H10DRAFT_1959051 [Mycena sp. CBHHK59/15]
MSAASPFHIRWAAQHRACHAFGANIELHESRCALHEVSDVLHLAPAQQLDAPHVRAKALQAHEEALHGRACEVHALDHLERVQCVQQARKHGGHEVMAAVQCSVRKANSMSTMVQQRLVSKLQPAIAHFHLRTGGYGAAGAKPRLPVEMDNVLPERDLGMLLRLKNHMLGRTSPSNFLLCHWVSVAYPALQPSPTCNELLLHGTIVPMKPGDMASF